MTAKEIIRKEYGTSKNFITPTILSTRKLRPWAACELSQGTGFSYETIYGVSIVVVLPSGNTHRVSKLSDCFHNIEDAKRYINSLTK